MTTTYPPIVMFEVKLQELAKECGFEIVETPSWTYGPCGTGAVSSGTGIWSVYGEDGRPTPEFVVQFRPKK